MKINNSKIRLIVFIGALSLIPPTIKAEENYLVNLLSSIFGSTFNFNKTVKSWFNPPKLDNNDAQSCSVETSAEEPMSSAPPAPMPPEPTAEQLAKENPKPLTLREKTFENFKKLGGDEIALTQALCFLDKNKNQNFRAQGDPSRPQGIKIANQRYITINDQNSPMSKARFFVIDLETGKVETYFSSHGGGGKKGVPESTVEETFTSNLDSSHASPRGFFITGSKRIGSSDPRWKFSMKLHGLQKGINDNSYARAIVMHPFPMMPPGSATSDDPNPGSKLTDYGPFAFSRGCPMLSEEHAENIIDRIKSPGTKTGGSLYYNYSKEEKSYGPEYCGDEGLMKK